VTERGSEKGWECRRGGKGAGARVWGERARCVLAWLGGRLSGALLEGDGWGRVPPTVLKIAVFRVGGGGGGLVRSGKRR